MKKNSGGEKCAVIKNKSQGSAFRFLNSDVIEQGLNLLSSNARTRNEKGEISGPFSKILGNSMGMPGDLAAAGAACCVSMEGEGLLPGPTADPLSQKVGLEQPTLPPLPPQWGETLLSASTADFHSGQLHTFGVESAREIVSAPLLFSGSLLHGR